MLTLTLGKNRKVTIGESLLTVLEFNEEVLYVDYNGDYFKVPRLVLTNLETDTTILYFRERSGQARLGLSSPNNRINRLEKE